LPAFTACSGNDIGLLGVLLEILSRKMHTWLPSHVPISLLLTPLYTPFEMASVYGLPLHNNWDGVLPAEERTAAQQASHATKPRSLWSMAWHYCEA
jgi:hypothetical protein